MKRKSPLPYIIGGLLMMFVVLYVLSQVETLKIIIGYISEKSAQQVLIQLILTLGLAIGFGSLAFRVNSHKALIVPIFLYTLFQWLSYFIVYIFNPSYFQSMTPQRIIEFAATDMLLIATVLSIIYSAIFKPLKKDDNAQPQLQVQQQPQEYEQAPAMNVDPANAEEELRKAEERFASGEISIAEYEEIRSRLSK